MSASTLILGGARSGKSTYAETLARGMANGGQVTYLATADSRDPEMDYRIERHRMRRPAEWKTWEGEMRDLPGAIRRMEGVLLLDCLTMYISRLCFATSSSERENEEAWAEDERRILSEVRRLMTPDDGARHMIVVSNEVGFGLVPMNLLGRRFRDLQGRANQIAASLADSAVLVVAGLPMWLKGAPPESA